MDTTDRTSPVYPPPLAGGPAKPPPPPPTTTPDTAPGDVEPDDREWIVYRVLAGGA
jgi:hypothetical protein